MPVIRFATLRLRRNVALAVLILSTPAAHAAVVEYGETTIAAGAIGQITVALRSEGAEIAGVQNDIGLPPFIRIVGDGNSIACRVNPAIGKEATAYRLLWRSPGSERLRAIVISLQNVAPIPDGVLYACDVEVAADTPPGRYALAASNVQASDPNGRAIHPLAISGAVYVASHGSPPHRLPAPPAAAAPGRQPPTAVYPIERPRPATPAAPSAPRWSIPTPTATPDAEAAGLGEGDAAVAASPGAGDGCQIGPRGRPGTKDRSGLLLLVLGGIAGLARATFFTPRTPRMLRTQAVGGIQFTKQSEHPCKLG
jgi:hypothetical protein